MGKTAGMGEIHMKMDNDEINHENGQEADIELIKEVLRTLAKRGVYLTTTRIQKLFYLFERQCILDAGKRCFNLDFRYDQYGMYSPALREILKHLEPEKDHLQVSEAIFEKGSGRMIGFIGEWDQRPLPDFIESAVAKVISEYGYLKTETLIERAKGTSPFVYAKKGEKVNWNRLAEERSGDSDELSPSGISKLERAVNSNSWHTFDNVDEVKSYLFS